METDLSEEDKKILSKTMMESQSIAEKIKANMDYTADSFSKQKDQINIINAKYNKLSQLSNISNSLVKKLRKGHYRNVFLVYLAFYFLISVVLYIILKRTIYRKFLKKIFF
jgi:hypothetical protein